MNVYRIQILVIDHDGLGEAGVREEIENVNYPNDCLRPHVLDMETRQIEWSDDHPLNSTRQWREAAIELFGKKEAP